MIRQNDEEFTQEIQVLCIFMKEIQQYTLRSARKY